MIAVNAKEMIETLAKKNNTTPESIQKEISDAINTGLSSPDKATREKWQSMSLTSNTPTPEEVIEYCIIKAEKFDEQ